MDDEEIMASISIEDLAIPTQLEDRYAREFGTKPHNLSHWDPAKETHHFIMERLRVEPHFNIVDYHYSYDLQVEDKVLTRLGQDPANRTCLMTPNGTISLFFAANWLKSQGISKILIPSPVYFPVTYGCEALGLDFEILHSRRLSKSYCLAKDKICEKISRKATALWVTNPFFSTGIPFSPSDITFLETLLQNGKYVVADECLALDGSELGRTISYYPRFLGIYSPHKSILVNGLKFSAITAHKSQESSFAHWADVIPGGLNPSSIAAIRHYLSPNFSEVNVALRDYIDLQLDRLHSQMSSFEVETDVKSSSHFMSIYLPNLEQEKERERRFLWQIIKETGASFIPGSRSYFPPEVGFSFRVNLGLASPSFFGALIRLLHHLENSTQA